MNHKKLVWKERDADLEKAIRFHDPKHRFEVMMYRTNLLVHTTRVPLIVEALIPLAQTYYEEFDPNLVRLIAKYHDDPELVALRGDVSLQLKLKMDDDEKEILRREEIEAINQIAKFYPKKVGGYNYKAILMHALHKDCPEAQLHSLADKWDGCCESLHEVFAGNLVFVEPVLNYYQGIFGKRYEKFSLIKELFIDDIAQKNSFLQFPTFDFMDLFDSGKRKCAPHTQESLSYDSKIPAYEAWKKITLSNFPNGLDLLTRQKEFQ